MHRETPTDAPSPKPRIVAIDDDPRMLDLLRALLHHTYDVATFQDPRAGVAGVLAQPPRLVLTDLDMPGVSGIDVIAEIRSRHSSRALPIVVLSGDGDEESVIQCFAVGATDYILKPITPGALRAKVALLLARAAAAEASSEDTPVAAGAASDALAAPRALARSADGRDPLVGTVFAGYHVTRRIGQGGMGVVYDATAPDGERVALKLLAPNLVDDKKLLARFFREAENLKAVRAPNIAAFRELGQENLRYYLAMEYVDGPTLDELLAERGGRLPPEEAREAVLQIARALVALHAKGIVHRDIKPSNILVAQGAYKLVDFGLTRGRGDGTITEADVIVGTAGYLAPELIVGHGTADIRSDLYALGVLAYRVATGDRPFPGENAAALIYQHVHERPRDPSTVRPEIPRALGQAILRLLEKRPEDRFQTPADLVRALEADAPARERS